MTGDPTMSPAMETFIEELPADVCEDPALPSVLEAYAGREINERTRAGVIGQVRAAQKARQMSGCRPLAADYPAIEKTVREHCGDGFEFFIPYVTEDGNIIVEVRMKPKVDRVVFTITGGAAGLEKGRRATTNSPATSGGPSGGPRSYPDAITSPVDPPSVGGTDVTESI